VTTEAEREWASNWLIEEQAQKTAIGATDVPP